ncbi:hypothetical protein ERO13_D13G047801v2 [Gossypium hirsutum]|uniref:Uncharacterized protein n=1 Tax=Gossypium darwinii TaxID=34276 RepID=A0A5D1ZXB8_GOSDA|nr:hypothetical protein ERO13_D13G047801v2 [Gossypium hirsutum]TYG36317.1 hypothetical protein ES288_D13G055600v1 [Gossypium darwinii]TYG36318.1 hypothetical protein ES288_D13G055600v1 [Gossypium darwinii]
MHKLCKDLPWLSALIPNLQPICLTDLQPWKLYVVAFSLDDCCNYNPSVI